MYKIDEIEKFAIAEAEKKGLEAVIVEVSDRQKWMTITDRNMERSYNFPKKGVDKEWVLKKIEEFLNVKNTYINVSNMMGKILNIEDSTLECYPTSYGVGISNIFNVKRDEILEKIENFFNKYGIEYKIKISNGGFVTKVIISKSKKNLEKINQVIALQELSADKVA